MKIKIWNTNYPPPPDRLTFIDILKGIGIVFMIMGHMGFGNDFDFYIHGFHMPLFFFVSGYLFNIKRTFCEVISRKFKALIIPYASFGMVALCYFILFRGARQEKIIKFIKHFIFYNDTLPAGGALWFLTALFFGSTIFYLLLTKRSKKFIIPVVLFCLAAEFCFKIHLPYSISSAIIALPFMYAGFAFKSFEQKIDHIFGGCYLPFATILLFLSAFLIFKNDYVNLRTITVANPVLFYLSAIIAITGYLYISKSLEKTSSLFAIFFKKALVYIGENSIVYLCLNQIIISLMRHRVLDILENIALLIFVLIIISIIAYCINSSRILSAVFKGKF